MFNFLKLQIKKIEDEIGLGQIEELIEMAKDELHLVDYYIGIIFLYQSNNISIYIFFINILFTFFKTLADGNW